MHPHLRDGRLRLGEVQWGRGRANNQTVLTPVEGALCCQVVTRRPSRAQEARGGVLCTPGITEKVPTCRDQHGQFPGRSRREHEPKLPGRKSVPAWRPPRSQPLHKGPGLLTLPQARLPLTTSPTTLGQRCVAKSRSFLQTTKLRLRKTSPSRCHVACQG